MKLLSKSPSRNWFMVKEWTTKVGLKACICKCVWNRKLMPNFSLHDHYTGYVQPHEDDTHQYYGDSSIDVHGGITFDGRFEDGTRRVGFDMAHLYDEHINDPEEYAIAECERLAEQIASYKPTAP